MRRERTGEGGQERRGKEGLYTRLSRQCHSTRLSKQPASDSHVEIVRTKMNYSIILVLHFMVPPCPLVGHGHACMLSEVCYQLPATYLEMICLQSSNPAPVNAKRTANAQRQGIFVCMYVYLRKIRKAEEKRIKNRRQFEEGRCNAKRKSNNVSAVAADVALNEARSTPRISIHFVPLKPPAHQRAHPPKHQIVPQSHHKQSSSP